MTPGQSPATKERLTNAANVLAFRAGWRGIRALPESATAALFDGVAAAMYRRRSWGYLRTNYARVRPDLTEIELDALVRDGLRRYMRYYLEAFRLPAWSPRELRTRVRLVGGDAVQALMAEGKTAVCFLGHTGNWDLAGAWATLNLGPVTTVAERLKPEEVFEEFMAFRESLGMTVLPLTGGPPVLPELRKAAARPGLIALLADRDLTDGGIEVSTPGGPAKMAVGPAALAVMTGVPLLPVTVRHERADTGWRIVLTFHEQVPDPMVGGTRERVRALTQGCADAIMGAVVEHPADWHMMQPFFVDDVEGRRGP